MAQTTDGFVGSEFKLEVSADGATWTDISGWSTKVAETGGERTSSETHTADGDTPIVATGKRAARQIEGTIVYTEGASDAFSLVNDAYEGNTKLYIRWSPKGGAIGDIRRFSASAAGTAIGASIQNCLPPEQSADSGDLATAVFTALAPQFKEEVIAS